LFHVKHRTRSPRAQRLPTGTRSAGNLAPATRACT
jgi:hypothetical protein